MQIVIEIDEELYTALMNGYEEPYSRQFSDCVRSGTVLPDNHGRLIDADEIQFENTEFETYGDYCIAFNAIDEAETIIEARKVEK